MPISERGAIELASEPARPHGQFSGASLRADQYPERDAIDLPFFESARPQRSSVAHSPRPTNIQSMMRFICRPLGRPDHTESSAAHSLAHQHPEHGAIDLLACASARPQESSVAHSFRSANIQSFAPGGASRWRRRPATPSLYRRAPGYVIIAATVRTLVRVL